MASDQDRLNQAFFRLLALAQDLLDAQVSQPTEGGPIAWPASLWSELIPGPRSREDGRRVEAWALAQYFLEDWVEWSGVLGRYSRYYGVDPVAVTSSWEPLYMLCSAVADALFADRELARVIRQEVSSEARLGQGHSDLDDPSAVYRRLVEWARNAHFLRALAEADGNVENDASDNARQLEPGLPWSPDTSRLHLQAMFFLMNYRRSTLQFSWLPTAPSFRRIFDLLPRPDEELIEDLLSSVSEALAPAEGFPLDEAAAVINRIVSSITEVGYDAWLEDVTSDSIRHTTDGPTGSVNVNVIPGRGAGACTPILLVATRGASGKQRESFASAMKAMHRHLVACRKITKLVLVTTDTWDARRFEARHRRRLVAHHEHGVTFIFLQVGSPRWKLSRIAVDLG